MNAEHQSYNPLGETPDADAAQSLFERWLESNRARDFLAERSRDAQARAETNLRMFGRSGLYETPNGELAKLNEAGREALGDDGCFYDPAYVPADYNYRYRS